MSDLLDAISAAPRVELTVADIKGGQVARRLAVAADHGGPVLRTDIPLAPDAGPCICLLGPDAAEMALGSQRDAFSSDLGWRPILGLGFGQAVLNVDEPLHAQQRRMVAPAFTAEFIDRYVDRITASADKAVLPWRDGTVVDTFMEMRRLAFHVIAVTAGGLPEPAIGAAYRALCVILDGYDFETQSRDDFLARAALARQTLLSILGNCVRARRRQPAAAPQSVLDILLEPAADGAATLSDDEITGYLAILLIAGHDTGATMYGRALYVLAVMPEIADALARELTDAGWTATQPLGVPDLDRLRLLDRFMLEVGRLYPPLINLPRVIMRDLDFAGYRLTAGTRVAMAVAASHRLAAVHHDPERFDLGRYDDSAAARKTRPFLMLTFAGGGRMCLGMRFAQIEFKAIVSRVVTALKLTPCEQGDIAHSGFWSARPAAPLRIHARAR
ncbi:MAG TPA: cytochrome P450 [Casimicrobiaceae bacterium]|nr:cytochrome P450 [Casimicrobiaceae bacterium]